MNADWSIYLRSLFFFFLTLRFQHFFQVNFTYLWQYLLTIVFFENFECAIFWGLHTVQLILKQHIVVDGGELREKPWESVKV